MIELSISILATTPYNWAADLENTYFDTRVSYSNYASSNISFATPEGNSDAALELIFRITLCTTDFSHKMFAINLKNEKSQVYNYFLNT